MEGCCCCCEKEEKEKKKDFEEEENKKPETPVVQETQVEQDNTEEKQEVFPAEEQGILPEETSEEIEQDMEAGEKNEDVYSEEGREKLVEDGEISPEEEGFMRGAENQGQLGKDALTGEPLMDIEDVEETEIDGQAYRFVNEENAQKFRERKEKEKSGF